MKSFNRLIALLCAVCTLCISLGFSTTHAEPKRPSTSKDLQRRAFFMYDNSAYGKLLFGEKFDPDDMNTWVCEKFLNGIPVETEHGFYTYCEYSVEVQNSDGTYTSAYCTDSFTLGGFLQFTDVDDYSLDIRGGFVGDTFTVIHKSYYDNFRKLNVREFNYAFTYYADETQTNEEALVSVISNNPARRIMIDCVSGKLYARATENNTDAFLGWYERGTDKLLSKEPDMRIDWYGKDHKLIEARFSDGEKLPAIGDIDDDGAIKTRDAVELLKYCVRSDVVLYKDYMKHDTNRDGYINTADAVRILRICAGIQNN